MTPSTSVREPGRSADVLVERYQMGSMGSLSMTSYVVR
jgi:hypothetical protein